MKTIYPITLLSLTFLLISSCTSSVHESSEDPSTILASNMVPLEQVNKEIGFYELGLELSPDTFTWDADTRTITYTSKIIDESDALRIDSLIRCSTVNSTETRIPFMKPKFAATSYFIDMDDITEAIQYGTNGLRVYMGSGGHVVDSSHIFIGPAQKDTVDGAYHYTDYYIGSAEDKYLLDLTTPCPKACGGGFKQLPSSDKD